MSIPNDQVRSVVKTFLSEGPVAQWIRHLTTNQGIPGSSPGGVVHFLFICFLVLHIIYRGTSGALTALDSNRSLVLGSGQFYCL